MREEIQLGDETYGALADSLRWNIKRGLLQTYGMPPAQIQDLKKDISRLRKELGLVQAKSGR